MNTLAPSCVAALLAATSLMARGGPPEDVSAQRVVEMLKSLPTARAALGDDAHRQGLRDTEKLIIEKLKEIGYEPAVQKIEWVSPVQRLGKEQQGTGAKKEGDAPGGAPSPAAESGPAPEFWNNIVIDLPGKELPNEVLLIGAHFDAVAKTPGADDNGTGTAALMELAHVLKDVPMKRTVRLVFFNLEEIGLIGSRQYVATQGKEKSEQRIVGMASLEMLGYFCLEEGCQKSPVPAIKGVFEPPTRGDTLAVVTISAHKDLTGRFTEAFETGSDGVKITRFDFLPMAIPDILRSDHAPFLAIGIPAFMLTDTSNFRNPNYHSPNDTIETLDLDRYVRSVRGVTSAVVAIAEPFVEGATKAEN